MKRGKPKVDCDGPEAARVAASLTMRAEDEAGKWETFTDWTPAVPKVSGDGEVAELRAELDRIYSIRRQEINEAAITRHLRAESQKEREIQP